MFCKYCGAVLESNALFCTGCGKKIETTASEDAEREQGAPADAVASASSQAERTAWQARREQPPQQGRQPLSGASAGGEWDKASLKKLNPFCIAGLILTVLSLFLVYFVHDCIGRYIFNLAYAVGKGDSV